MAFCTKCGSEIDKSWKHCPSCGQAVLKKPSATTKATSSLNAPTSKEVRINANAEPVVNGIPQSFKRMETSNPAKTAVEAADSKRLMVIVGILVFALIFLVIAANVRGSNVESAVPDEVPVVEVQIDPAVEQAKIDRDNFYTSLTAFLDAGCKPEITRPGPEFSDKMASMDLPGVQGIADFPEKYNKQFTLGTISVQEWGSPIEKALVVAAAYESKLSVLYWDVFDLFRPQNELGKYKTKFNQYFNKADNLAKKLCYKNGEPSENQLAAADKSLKALADEWSGFITWLEEVNARSQDLHAELDSYGKPVCTETETNLPGYNIVKCTNLP
jgi:predicted  nucleic acid-binding Zn-ribbon protein